MAKKKLSRDQKREQKKRKRAQHQKSAAPLGGYNPMIQRLKEAGMDNYKFAYNPPGQEKMSEVLMAFIQPYKELAPTTEAMHKLIATALVAWNAALLPETEQEDSLHQVAQALPAETHEDFYAIVQEMIERKNIYFAHYDRMILDYELVDRGKDYHVSVISTAGHGTVGHDD